jgi:hypothetical protein
MITIQTIKAMTNQTDNRIQHLSEAYEEALTENAKSEIVKQIERDFENEGNEAVVIGKLIKAEFYDKQLKGLIDPSKKDIEDYPEDVINMILENAIQETLLKAEVDVMEGRLSIGESVYDQAEPLRAIIERNFSIGDILLVPCTTIKNINGVIQRGTEYRINIYPADNMEMALSDEDLQDMLDFLKANKPK